MSVTDTYSREEALGAIVALQERYGKRAKKIHNANEAETRLLLVDSILEAIGWSKEDFNPETPAGKSYLDYSLEIDDIARVIVEAKRIGKTFRKPTFEMHDTHYALSYFKRAYGRAFGGVLKQARKYAHETGVKFAVLTNGTEWLLLQVIPPPGEKIADLHGFYFGKLLSNSSNFDLFWELLSKKAVAEGALEEHLAQLNSRPALESVTPKAQFGVLSWKEPERTEFLREFYNRFFSDITDPSRRRMLEKCFATDARLDQYKGELKRALRDSAPRFLPIESEDISPKSGERLLLHPTAERTGRVILVTGSVGSGKTTLVTKVLVEARQKKEEDHVVLLIDLIDEIPNGPENIEACLWDYISDEWRNSKPESYHLENLRKYFGMELSELRHGAYADVIRRDEEEYERREAKELEKLQANHWKFFQQCWRYYQQRGCGISLILDNVDRASASYQRNVYAFAHKLARLTGVTVIVTMRESTFFKGQMSGFLDVRTHDTVLHLQAPNLEQLISKRIQYVEGYIDEDHRVSKWRKFEDWEQFKIAALTHAEMLKKVFLIAAHGRDILSILASISWHNVRHFLETLRRLHLQLGTSERVWRIPEVVAALMTTYKHSLMSPVISNIFRPPYTNYTCYYLKLRILLFLAYGLEDGEVRRGVSLPRIIRFGRLYGYQTRWIERAVEELVRERYLECLEAPAAEEFTRSYDLNKRHTFRVSPLAVALVQHIVLEPIYLCLIGNDLPFHKPTAFERYKKALLETLELLDNNQMETAAVELVPETRLGVVVGKYLLQVFQAEQPSSSLIGNLPEISATEQKLKNILRSLQNDINSEITITKQLPNGFVQPSLGFIESPIPSVATSAQSSLPIPENIRQLKIGRSEYGPLLFWALVALKLSGRDLCSGVEVTDVINQYLVDDYSRKFPNNVSRALRSKTMQEQEWLITDTESHPHYKRYGLVENWEEFWPKIFNEPAPTVD